MINRIRAFFSLTQRDLAKLSKLTVQTIRRYEHGTAGPLSPNLEDVIVRLGQRQIAPYIKDWSQFLAEEIIELEDTHGITIDVPSNRPLSEIYEYWKTLTRLEIQCLDLPLPSVEPTIDHEGFRQEFMASLYNAGYKFDVQTEISSLKAYSDVLKVHTFVLLQYERSQERQNGRREDRTPVEDRNKISLPVELQVALKDIYPSLALAGDEN